MRGHRVRFVTKQRIVSTASKVERAYFHNYLELSHLLALLSHTKWKLPGRETEMTSGTNLLFSDPLASQNNFALYRKHL